MTDTAALTMSDGRDNERFLATISHELRMTESDAIVFVVDDNAPVREAVTSLLKSVGLRVEAFGSAHEFLASRRPDAPAGLMLDVRLPGLSGLGLQRTRRSRHPHPYRLHHGARR